MANQRSLKGVPNEDFQKWLDGVSKKFLLLSNDQRNDTLDKLISCSGPHQLNHLSTRLPQLLYRDYIGLLPQEVAYHILQYLPGHTLLDCCTVSQSWNAILQGAARVWWMKAIQRGAGDVVYYGGAARKYMMLYQQVEKLLDNFGRGSCFVDQSLEGHTNRVMAVCYRDGKVATGSDDQSVRVWDAHTGRLLHKMHTHTVSDLKLTPKHVYTASFDGTVACWELSTGESCYWLVGHTSAVFSIDVHDSGLVISGSSDKTVKIWHRQHEEPYLLTSLEDCHTEWVTKVQFLSVVESSNDLLFASIDKNICHVWCSDATGHCEKLFSTKKLMGLQITSFSHSKPGRFHLCTWKERELCNEISTYTFTRDSLTLVSTVPLGGDTPLRCQLLGAGDKFAALTSSSEIDQLFLFSFSQCCCVARVNIPLCRFTRNGATLTLGERSWLDGFNGTPPEGTVMAACLQNSSHVMLLNWKL
ncbi:F-box/WD repeat-containing protein 2-like [Haliotis rufescens]|uniref:F-box/WD repeat-containing protein 2-like n=1 Tax=Haliotis rufescens TaxID=6454 RepID=UPI00201F576E|nr:F-box/WD repeat-containing protein 2-like [Haliotis rufescens]XP_046373820.2 F-box/WD repeat-containing protein 2-like [Haliotis rufescens]XP_048259832.1 F-box/WD repeat-containing protein 2-like [Haliotis rufescens]